MPDISAKFTPYFQFAPFYTHFFPRLRWGVGGGWKFFKILHTPNTLIHKYTQGATQANSMITQHKTHKTHNTHSTQNINNT